MAARDENDGIRVNGVITPHADAELYELLKGMPAASGERMRTLKQLAILGLMQTQRYKEDWREEKRAFAVPAPVQPTPAPVPPTPAPPAAVEPTPVEPQNPQQMFALMMAQMQSMMAGQAAAPAPVMVAVAPVAAPLVKPVASAGAGAYDLDNTDIDGVDLSF